MTRKLFPIGARVYVYGKDEAIIAQVFPEGSTSYSFPHYKVHYVNGTRNCAVALDLVGVVKKEKGKVVP